jgi:hypothetical protein
MSTYGRIFGVFGSLTNADSGGYKIEGQALRDGNAYRARVLLFNKDSLYPIRDKWTGTDGLFSFENLALREYLVLAIDKTGERNAVAYSYVESVAM